MEIKIKKVALVISIFLYMATLQAQNTRIAEINRKLTNAISDSSKLRLLTQLSSAYFKNGKKDSAKIYAKEALKISQTNDPANRHVGIRHYGYIIDLMGEIDSAYSYYKKALQLAINVKDTTEIVYGLNHLAAYYIDIHNDSSMYYAKRALAYNPNPRQKSKLLRTIALVYFRSGNLDKAIATQKENIEICKDMPRDVAIGPYENLAGFYFYAKKYDSAKLIYQQLYRHFDSLNRLDRMLTLRGNIASLAYAKGDYYGAIEENKEVIRISKANNFDPSKSIINYDNLATNYRLIGKYNLAKAYTDTLYHLSKKHNLKSRTLSALDHYYLIDSLTQDYKGMVVNLRKKIDYKDSLEKVNHNQELARLSTEYETEKKDREIESLTQETIIKDLKLSQRNNQLLIGGLSASILLVGGFLFYQNDRNKKAKAAAELEQRFLRSQLNPHFIFNSMTAIQNYLFANKDMEKASHYIGMFSSLMRQILENSRKEYISLGEEIKMIKNYLELQKLRFSEGFEYEIHVDEDLDIEYNGIPPMFAQPFLENSLEHGLFKEQSRKNKIVIKFKKGSPDLIHLEIEDTGIGLQHTSVKTNHKSLATKITKERFESFSVSFKEKLGFKSENIYSSEGNISGYRVSLTLPCQFIAST